MIIYKILLTIIAYLLGSIPTAVWIGKWFYQVDVRTKGSGNAGATNTIRVLGWKAGLPVLLFDALKGWLAIKLVTIFPLAFPENEMIINYQVILGIAAVLGHIFPVFASFKGGKGVATLLGVGIALYPQSVLVVVGVFIVILLISRYVSLSSILAAITFPFIDLFVFNQEYLLLKILSIAVAIFVPLTHRKNIERLFEGTESRITLKKRN
jgi:glycerol-3-phosphate acyltransferase PlsY